MKRIAARLVALATFALTIPATADPTHHVYTLKPVDIVGRRVVPIAAVEVGKAAPALTPAPLQQHLVDRIGETAHSTAL
jgi:hypothetical protein